MSKFIVNNGLISRDSSIVTGSLVVTGQITASHFGTSSYVITASYSLRSDLTINTTAISIGSASYARNVVSSSVAITASVMLNPSYGPTPGIGYISPNIAMLSGFASTTPYTIAQVNASVGGPLMFPFIVNKDCTLVTMSMLGGVANFTTASVGVYSNSTNGLPEFLLALGTIRSASLNNTVQLYHASNFTPIKLYANNVYWAAYTSNVLGGFYTWRPAQWPANTCNSYNPLLGYAVVVSGSGTLANFMYPMWCLKSGSGGTTLALTASQSTSSYSPPSGAYGAFGNIVSALAAPYLRVTYP
jgi:hypothetical protein